VNDSPTISNITDKTIVQDTVTGISYTISDIDHTLDCSSSISVSPSNPSLITTGNIAKSGSAPSCILTLTPTASTTGTSTITVTVADASGASNEDAFVLTVTSAAGG